MRIVSRSRLVMIGDSVTDAERARPVGEGLFGATGKGYVSLVDACLQARHPERGIRVINMGSSGNTVRDLRDRWATDVLALEPDWLSIMIGINDVWRQFDLPRQTETHVSPDVYAETLEALVRETRPVLKNLVLMTPFFIEPCRRDPMRAQMDRYGKIVRDIARRHDALFVDTQAAFDQVLAHLPTASIAWDRVHPNMTGHWILARAFLAAVGIRI